MKNKNMRALILAGFLVASSLAGYSQPASTTNTPARSETQPGNNPKVVIITGARFSYKLVQKWIDDFNKVNPEIQVIIESRGSSDPANVSILAEVYEHDAAMKESREYINIGRYAILPVASAKSEFASVYSKKGLNTELIKQVYFHNIFADKDNEQEIKAPFTVYTRLQKAGVPIVFTKYFGYEQKDINGKAIAGSDEHLLKALLRDSAGISYLPLPLIYDITTKTPIDGLTVIPVDLDGNGKISDDEQIFGNLTDVLKKIESSDIKNIKNVPIEYLHISVDKSKASAEAIAFLKWVNEHGQDYLNEFGYLKPERNKFEKEKFSAFASKKSN